MTPRQAIELFHLQFLRVLMSGPDKRHFVVKGGCNLRFFHGSVRYSEDLDLDVETTAPATLRNKVDRILTAGPLPQLLASREIRIASQTAPKQTDTTQRWKIALAMPGSAGPLPTKIEFSRRGVDPDHLLEAVSGSIAQEHGIAPPLVVHYGRVAAFRQKVSALVGRTEVQARDVFDLHLLASRLPPEERPSIARDTVDRAVARVLDITYDEYAGQVVAYLEPDHQALHESVETWEQMQMDLIGALETLP